MDKNRLIQIANHFDKIGAYTVSDEFENKFIRTAAPFDAPRARSKKVLDLIGQDKNLITEGLNIYNRFLRTYFSNQNDVFAKYQYSINTFDAWRSVVSNYYTDTNRTNTKKAKEILKVAFNLNDAYKELQNTTPRGAGNVDTNSNLYRDIFRDRDQYSGNDVELLKSLSRDIAYEISVWSSDPTKGQYLFHLRNAEDSLADLATPAPPKPPAPAPPKPPAPATTKPATTTPATTTPATTTPAKPDGSSSGGKTPTKPNQGSGGSKPSTKPTSTKPGKLKEDDAGTALSDIILRKYRDARPGVNDRDILLGMRITESFTLKTYYDITKDAKLDASIRVAIKDSPYSRNFKDTMLTIYESKLKAAKEKNEGPTKITQSEPPKPSGPPKTSEPPKDDSDKKEPVKPDEDGFRCTREGLFTEIKRMDTLSENDPDKYMTQYFPNIKRVIDCHESIRNNLNLKDNTQIDVLINILESKYFSLVNKTQFPY